MSAVCRAAAGGALPLLAFGQFTPGYLTKHDEGMSIHLGANTPAGGVRRRARGNRKTGATEGRV